MSRSFVLGWACFLGVSAFAHSQSLVSVDDFVVSGLSRPVQVSSAGDGSGRLFVVEQGGRILVLTDAGAEVFLDLSAIVSSSGERGLLGLAFHPRYPENGFFFVDYTDTSGNTVVARYSVSGDPDRADPSSASVVLRVPQPFANHNGGQIHFGPFDDYLYIAMGDGGSANDPLGHGQSSNTLLGTLLRIDVDGGTPYAIPPDNPFVGLAGADEIWAFGLRNPWRFSFDRETGDLYIGDVGQGRWEEIDFLAAGSPGGANFGWAVREGPCPRGEPVPCAPAPPGLTDPIAYYGRTEGRSVSGGFVYRGQEHPSLIGRYFYGDFATGRLWSVTRTGRGPDDFSEPLLELETGLSISSFGEDENGELYVVDYGGTLRRLTALEPPVITDPTPGSRLMPFEQVFQWDASETPVTDWRLTAGSNPGGDDLFDSGSLGASTSVRATGLPADGGNVYVRLWYRARGAWRFSDFDFLGGELSPPSFLRPAPAAALGGRFALFVWSRPLELTTALRLTAGSSPGANDFYDSGELPGRRRWALVTGLPRDGGTIHLRLAYEVGKETLFVDAAYPTLAR